MFALTLLALLGFKPQVQAAIIARVNRTPIEEVELQRKQRPGEDRATTLNRLILFKLAVDDAKRHGIGDTSPTKEEIESVLYTGFLREKLKAAGHSLEPSDTEMATQYEKQPMIRLRHLFLKKDGSAPKIKDIQRGLSKREPFLKLVLKHSQDESLKWGGDLDFRGVNGLPEAIYQAAVPLKTGAHLGPLTADDGIHFFEVLARMPYEKAPASYLEYLRGQLRTQHEEAFLSGVLSELRQKATIEIAGVSE